MSDQPVEEDNMPAEIDFTKAVRGLHHIRSDAKVFLPASIEPSVWQYFFTKAQEKHVPLSELLTEILRRDMEIERS